MSGACTADKGQMFVRDKGLDDLGKTGTLPAYASVPPTPSADGSGSSQQKSSQKQKKQKNKTAHRKRCTTHTVLWIWWQGQMGSVQQALRIASKHPKSVHHAPFTLSMSDVVTHTHTHTHRERERERERERMCACVRVCERQTSGSHFAKNGPLSGGNAARA